MPSTRYSGSCHGGQVAFEVEGEIDSGMSCNCSICSRKGSLLWVVPRDQLKLKTPEDAAATNTLNKHVIKHPFCPTCGNHPNGEGLDPKRNAMAPENLRSIEALDLGTDKVHENNGRDH